MEMQQFIYQVIRSLTMEGLGVSLFLGYLIQKITKERVFYHANSVLNICFKVSFIVTIAISIKYVFYPGYLDHLESTVTSLGLMFGGNNFQLYPPINQYTFHGIIYGPLLTEIQAFVRIFPFDAIANSKIPGIVSIFLVFIVAIIKFKSELARGYLLILLPFGSIVYWVRSEPIFLLISSLCCLVTTKKSGHTKFFLGILGGAASCLKIHGVLYIIPFLIIDWMKSPLGERNYVKSLSYFILGFIFTVTLCYSPESVSIEYFFQYIKLASGHGILIELALRNFVFSVLLLIPVCACIQFEVIGREEKIGLTLIVVCVFVVVILGAKIGSGTHHLLPFIVLNAFLINIYSQSNRIKESQKFKYAFIAIAFYYLVAVVPKSQILQKNDYIYSKGDEIKSELINFRSQYDNLTILPSNSNEKNFSLTYYRVLLQANGTKQIDVSAFMDLNFAGISDEPLIEYLKKCNLPYVATPKMGEVLSIYNPYIEKPLFSSMSRSIFNKHYEIIQVGDFYNIYKCVA